MEDAYPAIGAEIQVITKEGGVCGKFGSIIDINDEMTQVKVIMNDTNTIQFFVPEHVTNQWDTSTTNRKHNNAVNKLCGDHYQESSEVSRSGTQTNEGV